MNILLGVVTRAFTDRRVYEVVFSSSAEAAAATGRLRALSAGFTSSTPVSELTNTKIICTDLKSVVAENSGLSQLWMYPVGSLVLVAVYKTDGNGAGGIILGCVNRVSREALDNLDTLFPMMGVDTYGDEIYVPQDKDRIALYDTYRRSLEAYPGRIWGFTSKYGPALALADHFAFIRGGDAASVTAFSIDSLLRVVGYNFEKWTSGTEEIVKDDEGEILVVNRLFAYNWEATGVRRGAKPVSKQGAFEYGKENRELPLDFSDSDVGLPKPRKLSISGYAGGISRDFVLGYPSEEPTKISVTGGAVDYGKSAGLPVGLLDIATGSNGSYHVRSRHSLTFEKAAVIKVPVPIIEPEDPTGDSTDSGYAAGGVNDTAKQHLPVDNVEVVENIGDVETGDDPDRETRSNAAGAIGLTEADRLIYSAKWLANKPFVNHKKDWALVSGKQDINPDEKVAATIASLDDRYSLGLPESKDLKLDHRNGSSRYYISRSYISQTPDGSIVIEDAYGSTITMSGGNIEIACPGDVIFRPGRSFVSMPRKDAVIKAGKSVDITTNTGDIRLKAEKNMQVLAGNSGTGGILLESRGTATNHFTDVAGEEVVSGGITMVSNEAAISLQSDNIFMYGDLNGDVDDASDAKDPITGETAGSRPAKKFFDATTDVYIKGNVHYTNRIKPASHESVFHNMNRLSLLDYFRYAKGAFGSVSGTTADPEEGGDRKSKGSNTGIYVNKDFRFTLRDPYMYTTRAGSASEYGFGSLTGVDELSSDTRARVTRQYSATWDFEMFETRWQNMYRSQGIDCTFPDETPVKTGRTSQGTLKNTYSYPGRYLSRTASRFVRLAKNLFVDWGTGKIAVPHTKAGYREEFSRLEGGKPSKIDAGLFEDIKLSES